MPSQTTPASYATWRLCILGRLADCAGRLLPALVREPEFSVGVHETLAAARAEVATCQVDLALVSVDLALRHRTELFGGTCPARVAVFTDKPDLADAVRWMRAGAVDYFALNVETLATLPARLRGLMAAPGRSSGGGQRFRAESMARHLAITVEKAGDGLTLSDERGHFVVFNRQMRRITGYTRALAGNLPDFLRLLHPDAGELRRADERVREVLATGRTREAEVVASNRRGERLQLSVAVSPVRIGERLWVLGTYRDVTALRRSEAALELREARSQSFNHALAGLAANEQLFRAERSVALTLVADSSARALGVPRVGIWFFDVPRLALVCAAVNGKAAAGPLPPGRMTVADHPDYFAALERREVIAAGDAAHDPATRSFIEPLLKPLGIGAILDVPVRSAGRVVGVVRHEHTGAPRVWSAAEQSFASAIGSCVSLVLEAQARREAEGALHAANDRLNEIVEFLPDATYVINSLGTVTAWNGAMETLTGVLKADMLGRGNFEYALPFFGERRPLLIDLALRPGDPASAHYDLYRNEGGAASGEVFAPGLAAGRGAHLWCSARPLSDHQGRVIGAIESIRDITQRKQAETEIVAWKRRYELVAVASGQIAYEYNLETGFILWSESVDQVLGYALSEMGGTLLRWMRLVHPEDRHGTLALLRRSSRAYAPFDAEYRMRTRDGGYLWFRDRGYYIVTPDRARCMIGMLTDITASKHDAEALQRAHAHLEDRVRERTAELATANTRLRDEISERERAQQALAASEQKYRVMVDSLPQVVYELDLHGNVLVLNREGLKAGGLGPADLGAGVNLFSLIHPDDHERLRANWARLLAGQNLTGEEYRFVRRDGASFIGSSYAHVIIQDGRPVGVTGFLVDETRRKQAEEVLRKAHADLEDRVRERTAELAKSNDSLRRLLEKQEMNIGLAHQVLLLVNAEQPRNSPLPEGRSLFAAGQLIPRYLEGGDHFFTRHLSGPGGGRTLVSLKDQSGHEVGCILRSIITDLIHNSLLGPEGAPAELDEVATRLNREICQSHLFRDGDFFTALNLEIDHATLRMTYVVAGHPPFLLVRDGAVQSLPALAGAGTNLPVGMIDRQVYSAATLQLRPGDKLLLYTDGLLEIPAAHELPHLSSDDLCDRLGALVARHPEAHVVWLAKRLFEQIAGCGCDEAASAHALPDDVALVALEVETPGPTFEDCLRPTSLAELRTQRARLTTKIEDEWRRHGVTASLMRLHIVLEEALYNAWHHGNREDPEKWIVVRRRYGNDACLEVIDEGAGFVWDQVGDPTAHENRTKPSGRGLFLIRRFADEAHWSEGGRHLTLYFGDEATFCPPAGRSPIPRFDLWKAPHLSTTNHATS